VGEPLHQNRFFRGGTPSTFRGQSIATVLDKASGLFRFDDNAEVTLEANPGTVDARHFRDYRGSGVNRISIGAQTFNARLLEFLGRVHSGEETHQAVATVCDAGFDNFSLDLIYAMPGQSTDEVRLDLLEGLKSEPPHLSVYNLTIEEGTPFHTQFQQGRLQPLDEDTEIAMAREVAGTLSEAGLQRYEISNYARAGFESRHNVNYWQGGDYLGIGAGAHSFNRRRRDPGGIRWQNERIPARYIKSVQRAGNAVSEEETPSRRQAMGEHLFTGLRLLRGIPVPAFQQRFGVKPHDAFPKIMEWLDGGLLLEEDEHLRFTEPGLLLANELFVEFV
jgi:oxygen-independent coproporphyrinogen III oxidase